MKIKLILIFITLVGLMLRLYKINELPPGLNRDEAALGYNAYSLLLTGRDEYGRFWPLSLESFGDWKLPLYAYLTVPVEAVLGMTIFSTRFISIISGTLAIPVIYSIGNKIRGKKFGLMAAALLAFSPWNIYFSRVAYEANLALFLFIFGTYFFLQRRLIFASVALGLVLFTYHGGHVFIPLYVFSLWLIFRKEIRFGARQAVSIIIFLIFLGGALLLTINADKTKISGIGIFSDKVGIYNQVEQKRLGMGNNFMAKIIYNRPVYFTSRIVVNYLRFFSPDFLVFKGGNNPQHNLPNMGNLTLFEYGFFLIGIVFAMKSRNYLLLAIILIAPVAASITRDAPHYTRSVFAAGVIPIFIALAISDMIEKWPKIGRVILLLYVFCFGWWLKNYFVDFSSSGKVIWNAKMIESAKSAVNQKGVVSLNHPDYSPYIFILFYSKYDPTAYQSQVVRYPPTDEGFVHVRSFDKYTFLYD